MKYAILKNLGPAWAPVNHLYKCDDEGDVSEPPKLIVSLPDDVTFEQAKGVAESLGYNFTFAAENKRAMVICSKKFDGESHIPVRVIKVFERNVVIGSFPEGTSDEVLFDAARSYGYSITRFELRHASEV